MSSKTITVAYQHRLIDRRDEIERSRRELEAEAKRAAGQAGLDADEDEVTFSDLSELYVSLTYVADLVKQQELKIHETVTHWHDK